MLLVHTSRVLSRTCCRGSRIRYFGISSVQLNETQTKSKIDLPERESTIQKFDFKSLTHNISDISDDLESLISQGKQVTLNGWIDGTSRKMSKRLFFASFRDVNGEITQIISKNEEMIKELRKLKPEDSITIDCLVKHTQSSSHEYELEIKNFEIVNKSDVLVSELDELKENPSSFPPEYRYLQLRLPQYQRALKMRSKAASIIRDTFRDLKFSEIETPLLFKSTPEGANEFLVPTRSKDLFYALPQSPQQYKQLLMASGVKNYYQIARCFRDEDLRSDRQPEFTQIDLEMSFAKSDDVKFVVEKLVTKVWREVRDLELYKPVGTNQLKKLEKGEHFPRLSYEDALRLYGIDKPDLRSSLSFKNVSSYFEKKHDEFEVVEMCVLKQAFDPSKSTKFAKGIAFPGEYSSRRPVIVPIKTNEDVLVWQDKVNPHFKTLASPEEIQGLNQEYNLQPGDIIAVSDRAQVSYENPTPLGRFRQLAIRDFPGKWQRDIIRDSNVTIAPEDIFVATWVVNFPLFSPIEQDEASTTLGEGYPNYDYNKFESTHHPFTMAKLEDYDYLATDPLKVKGDHYDLVVNGVELGGGSRRVHDSDLQRYIFTNILRISDPDYLFGHLLTALSTGCPPHAGLAIGFDRMCAMLLNSSTIRDVIAFPKTQSGADAVVGSPSAVPKETLGKYHIGVVA